MTRRLVRYLDKRIGFEYTYEGDPYEREFAVEMVLALDDKQVLWRGTVEEAHEPCSRANSTWLPSALAGEGTSNDALWSLVADNAFSLCARDVHVTVSRDAVPVATHGAWEAKLFQAGRTYTTLNLGGAHELTLLPRPHAPMDWVLVTAAHGGRILVQDAVVTELFYGHSIHDNEADASAEMRAGQVYYAPPGPQK